MAYIYLSNPDFVRSITNISTNTQDKFMQTALREATEIDLVEILGSQMVRKLQSLVSDGTIQDEENAKYKKILDMTQYFLAYSVVSRLVVVSGFKIDNLGVSTTSDDKVQPLSMSDTFQLEKFYRNKADFFKNKIQLYLCEYYNDYPEVTSYHISDIKANLYSANSCGVFLGGARGKGNRKITRLRDKYYNA